MGCCTQELIASVVKLGLGPRSSSSKACVGLALAQRACPQSTAGLPTAWPACCLVFPVLTSFPFPVVGWSPFTSFSFSAASVGSGIHCGNCHHWKEMVPSLCSVGSRAGLFLVLEPGRLRPAGLPISPEAGAFPERREP